MRTKKNLKHSRVSAHEKNSRHSRVSAHEKKLKHSRVSAHEKNSRHSRVSAHEKKRLRVFTHPPSVPHTPPKCSPYTPLLVINQSTLHGLKSQ